MPIPWNHAMRFLRTILDFLDPVSDLRGLDYAQTVDAIGREERAADASRFRGEMHFHLRRKAFLRKRAAHLAIRLPISGF